MRTVQEIYTHYRINSGLQLHQLRVAAVGATIARSQKTPVDERSVTLACLFHDMGNIIKFDFNITDDSLVLPEGVAYWKNVQKEFLEKFGANEHEATRCIVEEIPLQHEVLELIKGMGFSKAQHVLVNGSREQMIVEYADQRVDPYGIVSMHERLAEGKRRYAHRGGYAESDPILFEEKVQAMEKIESILFEGSVLHHHDITEESLADLREDLRNYPVA